MPLPDRIEHLITAAYRPSARQLGVYRMLYAATMLLLGAPRSLWIRGYPDAFYSPPPGPATLFSGFPSCAFFIVANGLLIVALVALLFGYRTRIAALGVAALILTLNTFEYSFGKINHDILVVVIPLVLAFSSWGDALSLDARQRAQKAPSQVEGWPSALLALLLGLLMLAAAIPKVRYGWLRLDSQAVLAWVIAFNRVWVDGTRFGDAIVANHAPRIWEAFDWITVFLEASFLFAFLSPRWLRRVCALAVFFHAGILLTLNIFFWENLIAYAAFFDFSQWLDGPVAAGYVRRAQSIASRLRGAHVLALGLLIAVGMLTIGNPFCKWGTLTDEAGFFLMGVVVLAACAFLVRTLRARD